MAGPLSLAESSVDHPKELDATGLPSKVPTPEGPSAAEVATSFPAHLLGAIEELWKFLNS